MVCGFGLVTSGSGSFWANARAPGISFFLIETPWEIGTGASSFTSNLFLTEFKTPPTPAREGSFIIGLLTSSFLANNPSPTPLTEPI